MAPHCDATTRAGTPCRRPAGWGTEHPGTGRCKLHGGASTGPKDLRGNKNALKTGEHEAIWLDALDDDEQQLVQQIPTEALELVRDAIRLASIRERRMMRRIQSLAEDDFTIVERKVSHKVGVDATDDEDGSLTAIDVTTTTVTDAATLGQIQTIEQALTRVQAMKTRLIDLLHKLASGEQLDDPLLALMDTIAASRRQHGEDSA